jgi:hypothetical protein
MPEFDFNVTEEALEYMANSIKGMPGNEGQRVLTERLAEEADAEAIVTVSIEGPVVNVDSRYSLSLSSSHPDAIQDIMNAAEQYFEEFVENASSVMGLVDLAFDEL